VSRARLSLPPITRQDIRDAVAFTMRRYGSVKAKDDILERDMRFELTTSTLARPSPLNSYVRLCPLSSVLN
jgi:hypothetical protein